MKKQSNKRKQKKNNENNWNILFYEQKNWNKKCRPTAGIPSLSPMCKRQAFHVWVFVVEAFQVLSPKTPKNSRLAFHVYAFHVAWIEILENCRAFQVPVRKYNDDSTGLWKNICDSTRITGIWYQVLPKLRILCWSFYGQTYCADGSHKAVNDHLLEQIFEISSQFGDIPVLVAGDFQSDPNELDSFTNARRFGWCDPLTTVRNGEHERPITFSRTSNFENPTYGFSSIDGILMNDISFQALQEIRVCHEVGTPHAPIYATFVWPRVFVQGTVLVKPASFDLTNLPLVDGKLDECKIQDIAKNLWTPQKRSTFFNCGWRRGVVPGESLYHWGAT